MSPQRATQADSGSRAGSDPASRPGPDLASRSGTDPASGSGSDIASGSGPDGGDAPMIQARDLGIGYPGREVGSGLTLDVSRHEVLCLLGPNGSGKSTLFKTLLGLIPALSGQVLVGDRPVSRWSRQELARQLAYVPQAQDGTFGFTVLDVVLMGRSARMGQFSGPSAHDRDVARQCLEQMGIAGLARRRYTEISGGERQLALIARALAQEPAIMVMDEPTASLDFGNQMRVLEHIRNMRQQGVGILLCTHQPDHALQVADRIVLLKHGRLRSLECSASRDVIDSLAWLYDLKPEIVEAALPASFRGLIPDAGQAGGPICQMEETHDNQ